MTTILWFLIYLQADNVDSVLELSSLGQRIDYPGGWVSPTTKHECFNICDHPNVDSDFIPGVYDYLMLEQLHLPQYCRALLEGTDYTLSHQNVDLTPKGVSCQHSSVIPNELMIHGLWPNSHTPGKYPHCCKSLPGNAFADTLPVQGLRQNYSGLLNRMTNDRWFDPAQADAHDTLCGLYNHEYQKHGSCFNVGDTTLEKAVEYFTSTLAITATLKSKTDELQAIIMNSTSMQYRVSLAKVTALYPFQIQVYCSAQKQVIGIRTCWYKPPQELRQTDCPKAQAYGQVFFPCLDLIQDQDDFITFHPYTDHALFHTETTTGGIYPTLSVSDIMTLE